MKVRILLLVALLILGISYMMDRNTESDNEPFIGINYVRTGVNGSLVRTVIPGTAAERYGIRPGDEIVGLDGERVCGGTSMDDLMDNYKKGEKAELLIIRNGEEVIIENFRFGSEEDVAKAKYARNVFLGVSYHHDDLPGVKILKVVDNSTAEDLGLRKGDRITALNGLRIERSELASLLRRLRVGDEITLTFTRNGEELTETAEIKSRAQTYGEN